MHISDDIDALEKKAFDGDVAARFEFAYHLYYGFGIKANIPQAYHIFEDLAEEGYIQAQDALNVCFDKKGLINPNFKDRYKEVKTAVLNLNAKKADYYDLYLCAKYALYGVGLPFNKKWGFEMLELLAEKGYSTCLLGECYLNGDGTEEDDDKAYQVFQKCFEEDNEDAEAIYYLAMCCCNGWGCGIDYVKAIGLFELAVSLNYSDAYYDLGLMYRLGQGVKTDMNKAIDLYQKGILAGDRRAMNNLGIIYYRGINGVPVDYERALQLFEMGDSRGMVDSTYCLGEMYFEGNGVKQDYKKAFSYFEKGAMESEPDCLYHLGLCYAKGLGTKPDNAEAVYFMRCAANLGNEMAKEYLKLNDIPLEDPQEKN